MRSKLIVILEDDPDRTAAMKEALQRELPLSEAIFFDNAPDMVAWLKENIGKVCVLSRRSHDTNSRSNQRVQLYPQYVGGVRSFLVQSYSYGIPVRSSYNVPGILA